MRLVLDEGIGQREIDDSGGRSPCGEFLGGTERIVNALVETLANKGSGHGAVEEHNRVVVADEAR